MTTTARRSPFAAAAAAAHTAPAVNDKATGKEPRPEAQIFVNFGYLVEVQNAEAPNGVEEMFIGTPYGLPLDTMNESQVRGQSGMMANIAGAKNNWLRKLVDYGQSLEPGAAEYLIVDEESRFAVELRRRAAPLEARTDGSNPLVRDITFQRAG